MLIFSLLSLLPFSFAEDRLMDLAESELLRSWETLSQQTEAAYWIGLNP